MDRSCSRVWVLHTLMLSPLVHYKGLHTGNEGLKTCVVVVFFSNNFYSLFHWRSFFFFLPFLIPGACMSVQYVRLVRARASSVVLLWETLRGCRTTYLQTPALLSTFPFEWKGSDGGSTWAVTWVSPPHAYFTNLSECDRLVTLTNLYADAHQQGGELALES